MSKVKLKRGIYFLKNYEIDLFIEAFMTVKSDVRLLLDLRDKHNEDIALNIKGGNIDGHMLYRNIKHSNYDSLRKWDSNLKEWRHHL